VHIKEGKFVIAAVVQFVLYYDFVVAQSLGLRVLCSVVCCVCALNSRNKNWDKIAIEEKYIIHKEKCIKSI
jgi:hypothetical protein